MRLWKRWLVPYRIPSPEMAPDPPRIFLTELVPTPTIPVGSELAVCHSDIAAIGHPDRIRLNTEQ